MEFHLQEEIQSLAEPELYQIPNELDVEGSSPRELDDALEAAIETIARSSVAIAQLDTFDVYRSLVRHVPALAPPLLSKLVDSLVSAFGAEIDATTRDIDAVAVAARMPGLSRGGRPEGGGEEEDEDAEDDEDRRQAYLAHRQPLEMYAFLLMWFVQGAEKIGSGSGAQGGAEEAVAPRGKGKAGKSKASKAAVAAQTFSWPAHIPLVLGVFHKALRIRTERIWTTTQEREAFVGCFTRPAYQIAETEAHLKSIEVRLGVYKVICLAVKFHGSAFGAQTTVMQNLTYFEHMSEPMAELLTILEKEFDHIQVTEEILREISTKHFVAQDAKGPRSIGRFLVKLAELSPRLVLKQMSLLQAHLDCEAYLMRIAIIEILGTLIKDISLSDEGDEAQKKKQIKAFFELLFERCLDLNSWVRGKVLQTLIKLCDLPNKFPKQRQRMAEMAIRSLEDKTSSVRKHSIQLLCKLVETHPFGALHGGTLNLGEWQERYDKVADELKAVDLKEMEKARADAGLDEEGEEVGSKRPEGGEGEGESQDDTDRSGSNDDGGEDASGAAEVKDEQASRRVAREESQAPDLGAISAEQANMDGEAIVRLRLTKKYYTDALLFINQIEGAIPTLSQLLVSTTKSEVLESMRFFRTAYEYNFQSAEIGIKTMIHLIWTKDNSAIVEDGTEVKGIRSNLIDVYKALYFDVVPDLEPKQQVNRIAKNMIERTYGATLAELTSLEELMRTMMIDNSVHPDVINKLWQVYGTQQEIPKVQRRGAIIILGMLAVAKRDVVTERVETLLNVGLGPLGQADLQLARYTCVALQRLSGSTKKVKGSLADKGTRLPMNSLIFARLQQVVEMSTRSSYWFGVAEQAINAIYLLGEQPDQLCGDIIKNLHARAFAPPTESQGRDARDSEGEEGGEDAQPEAGPSSPRKEDATATAPPKRKTSSFKLAQLVFVVGHIAIKHIVYLELVEREFKRRKDETAKANAAAKPVDKDGNDLDAVAGNAEDDIGDLIATIRERELLYGEHSLLATYGPLIAHICATPKVYRFPALRQAAALAMTKLMCVSAQYCEEHLLLLFKILETSKDPIIRSNIVIALGDIAVCFGSIIDDNSERLYEGLADSNLVVKKNTLMVLTHLILNGMIKVKGQLGEMAKCLEDAEPRISDLAKLFFTELSTKDNALYNNLQDVISHLSTGAHAVDEETFERTMRFIFTFVEKEKQAESIVEKLCQRFRLATEERQWRDIAFCLSLLPFKSEKSMKRLIEGLPFYQDKLHEETVYRRFNEILTKARSNKQSNKPETELKEFEAILAEHRAKGEEDQALEADIARKAAKAKRKAAKAAPAAKSAAAARPARKGARRRAVSEETEASSFNEDMDES